MPLAFIATTMPLGAVFGSVFESPQSMGLVMLPMFGLVAISGIFYPALRICAYFEVPMEVVFSLRPFPRLGAGPAARPA